MTLSFVYEEKEFNDIKIKIRPLHLLIKDYLEMKKAMEEAAKEIGHKGLPFLSVYREVIEIIEFLSHHL
jgi:DNA polymerase sigma